MNVTLTETAPNVRRASPIAGELKAMDITSKTAPGLFHRWTGLGDYDGIPITEHPLFRERTDTHEEDGRYIKIESIMEALRDEWAGSPWRTADEQARIDAFEGPVRDFLEELDQRGLDFQEMTDQEIKKALLGDGGETFYQPLMQGIDPDQKVTVVPVQRSLKSDVYEEALAEIDEERQAEILSWTDEDGTVTNLSTGMKWTLQRGRSS